MARSSEDSSTSSREAGHERSASRFVLGLGLPVEGAFAACREFRYNVMLEARR